MTTRKSDFIAYLQVTQDDLCLLDVCRALLQQGVQHFALFQPTHYWSGEPVPLKFHAELESVCLKLHSEGANVILNRVEVAPFISAKRIDTETKFRNHCLSVLRKMDFDHVLIVDGDELWVPGAFDTVRRYVHRGSRALCVGMIPVVGLPPYPVEGSKDFATVYIGPEVTFTCCRTPSVSITTLKNRLIYHFTGVRPTMDETILKHRRSGHYDDPRYDYEGWLKNRLPNLKPGDKNIHFYRSFQIWPKLRDWAPGELEKLPASVKNLCRSNTAESKSPATS